VPREIGWSSIVIWTIVWAPLGFVTYWLNRDGFSWYSLLSGVPAVLLFIATVGALLPETESPAENETERSDVPPTPGA
jgi:hypothetical protein